MSQPRIDETPPSIAGIGASNDVDSESPGIVERWSRRRGLFIEALGVSWLPWLVARALVLIALGLAKFQISHFHIANAKAVLEAHLGLLGSDAGLYQSIAAHGYGALPRSELRFFPLLPLLDRALHAVTFLTVGVSSLLIVNFASLLAAVGIYALVDAEFHDKLLARRAVWLITLAPPAFVFAMGYSDSILVLLVVAVFLNLRRENWWWAALFGFLAGTARPIGFLLVVPALVEGIRLWRTSSTSKRFGSLCAIAAPIAGISAYLGWASIQFGSFFEPLKIQQQSGHHGRFADPVVTMYHAVFNVAQGHHVGTALHVPWIFVVAALLIVTLFRLPASYGLFALAVVVVALSGSNLDSFERYALSAFPLTIAAATFLRSSRVAMAVYVLCGAAMVGYALLAFQGAYVP